MPDMPEPYWQSRGSRHRVYLGDVLTVLRTLPENSVHCVVTSPPYWGLRDYGTATWEGGEAECDHKAPPSGGMTKGSGLVGTGNRGGFSVDGQFRSTCGKCGARRIDSQLGLEPTPEAYVANMVAVFREVRRVLREDGTCWLNLGDSYAAGGSGGSSTKSTLQGYTGPDCKQARMVQEPTQRKAPPGLKAKDIVGIPWRVAFALQADGWWLRQDIIWHKPNPMPESVTDRCTKAHEYVFLLTKSARYFYDAEAVKEKGVLDAGMKRNFMANPDRNEKDGRKGVEVDGTRNKRSVWTVATNPYSGAHFATFPPALITPMILAGTSQEGCCRACGSHWERAGDIWQPTCECNAGDPVPCVVLDPFLGSGTTMVTAHSLGRNSIGIELNQQYVDDLIVPRVADETVQMTFLDLISQEQV
jgi:DNA modification methylase